MDVASLDIKIIHMNYGAPKIFYDEASKQYLISWHAGRYGNEDLDERVALQEDFPIF